jgi:hypothetical protein
VEVEMNGTREDKVEAAMEEAEVDGKRWKRLETSNRRTTAAAEASKHGGGGFQSSCRGGRK